MRRCLILCLVAAVILSGCSEESAQQPTQAAAVPAPQTALVDEARVANVEENERGAWLTFGRTYEEQRFSPLTEINRETVSDLGIVWYKDLNDDHPFQGTPLVIDGVMYFSTPFNIVYAVDAGTGEELWRYDTKVPRVTRRKACCGANARGVAAYKGRIYTATLDGRLIALDAATGARVWEVNTIIDASREYTITGAPRVAAGKVYIGNGGAEFGVRGYVTAYDSETGAQAWRFYTVPGNPSEPFEHPEMEMAAKTWKGGEWWKIGGGGTVWNSIVYDPDFNQVYLGVGNGAPWTRALRSPGGGDNLFLASIVAVDADTGKMNWYYQTTPGDNWDYTAVQDMTLADMDIDGESRKVLMQAPKNGFFYVLDREDGKLLRAHKFATVTWATHVDLETGRPVENPDTAYADQPKWVLPGPGGAHNWHAMAYDAGRRLMYFGSNDIPFLYAMPEEYEKTGLYKRKPKQYNLGIKFGALPALMREMEAPPAPTGFLNAFDPVTGEKRWVVAQSLHWNGGVLATSGNLVLQGDQTGTLAAFDSDTGDVLWKRELFSTIVAPPVTYEEGGRQHIAILTGGGGGVPGSADDLYGSTGRLVALALGGEVELPAPVKREQNFPEPPPLTASAEGLQRGEELFMQVCGVCHPPGVFAGFGGIPDLRQMSAETHLQWNAIVLGGSMRESGMDAFADVLSVEDSDLIQQYLISETIAARAAE